MHHLRAACLHKCREREVRRMGVERQTCAPEAANVNASCAEKVDLPTPPFPDSTRMVCLMRERRSLTALHAGKDTWVHGQPRNSVKLRQKQGKPGPTRGPRRREKSENCGCLASLPWHTKPRPGSAPRAAPEAHSDWFGHPAQESAFPAASDCVPGQPVA